MIKLLLSACIDAEKDNVWKVLSQVEKINVWVEHVVSAYCEGDLIKGAGTVRVYRLKKNITIKEKWISWDEGHTFTYIGYNIPMVKRAINTWSVESIKGKTLVTTQSKIKQKGGVIGKLLEPLMRLMSKKISNESRAALKYLVENKKPYDGKLSICQIYQLHVNFG